MADHALYQGLDDLLSRRHSCRAFEARPVPRPVIMQVLETAQRTASWCNAQPWQLHLASGVALERLRAALVDAAASHEQSHAQASEPDISWPREYRGVYRERRRECGWGLYESLGIRAGDRTASAAQAAENFRFFGAPHVVIVSSDEALGTYGVVDCGAYVANFMLAACSLGVASIAQASLASYPDVLRAQLDIPADRLIVCGISFGYEDAGHPANRFRTSRAPVSECVVWKD